MSKNPVTATVVLGIAVLGNNFNKIATELIKNSPMEEVSDEIMMELKKAIQDGIELITNTDEIDKKEVLSKLLNSMLDR